MRRYLDTYANGKPWATIGGVPVYRVWKLGGMPLVYWRSFEPRGRDSIDGMSEFDVRGLPGGREPMSFAEMEEVIRSALAAGILCPRSGDSMSTNAPRNRVGRPCRHGTPEAAAADRDRRRREYADLRSRLGMSSAALARLLGLAETTVRTLPCWSSARAAPTDATLAIMRQELVRRACQTLAEAAMRAEIEQEIAELEVRWHLRQCAEQAPPLEDAA